MKSRALIIVHRFIGDTLLATPLARALDAAGISVDWLAPASSAPVVAPLPWTRQVFTLDKGLRPWLAMLRRLRKQYEHVFLLTPTDRLAFLALSLRAHVHGLFSPRYTDWWKRAGAASALIYRPDRHIASYAFTFAESFGHLESREIRYPFRDEDEHRVREWVGTGDYLVIHPFARWRYKLWPEDSWKRLITRVVEAGYRVVITGAPEERERALALCEGFGDRAIQAAGFFSWPELSALLQNAKAFVGLDTAVTHLAAASGTPTIALFGPTNPVIWGPWPNGCLSDHPWNATGTGGVQRSENVFILQGTEPCVPCHREGCDRHAQSRSKCLEEIGMERVAECLEAALP